LIQLIHSFPETQLNKLKESLLILQEGSNRPLKALDLLDDILDNNISGRLASDSDRKQGEALENHILNFLINISEHRDELRKSSPQYHLEKRLIKARLLLDKGLELRAEQHFKTIQKKALNIEDYDLALRLQRIISSLQVNQTSLERFKTCLRATDDYEYLSHTKNKAIRLFNELKARRQAKLFENQVMYLAACSKELESLEKKSNSQTVQFIRFFFEKESHETNGEPGAAIMLIENLEALVDYAISSLLVKHPFDLIFERARLLFSLGELEMAKFFLEKCVTKYSFNNGNFLPCLEILVFIYHEQDNTYRRDQLIDSVLNEKLMHLNRSEASYIDWLYYKACVSLSRGSIETCIRTIERTVHYAKPNHTLGIHLRFLKITALIDAQRFDQTDREVEALRKFIARNDLKDCVEQNGLGDFYTSLRALQKKGYRFNELKLIHRPDYKPTQIRYSLFCYKQWWDNKRKTQIIHSQLHILRRMEYFNTGKYQPIRL
jgi:hypothetical protein